MSLGGEGSAAERELLRGLGLPPPSLRFLALLSTPLEDAPVHSILTHSLAAGG